MGIKSDVTLNPPPAPAVHAYPCIKRSRTAGGVVLFVSPGIGTRLNDGGPGIGHHSDSWSEGLPQYRSEWELLDGKITLSNG